MLVSTLGVAFPFFAATDSPGTFAAQSSVVLWSIYPSKCPSNCLNEWFGLMNSKEQS